MKQIYLKVMKTEILQRQLDMLKSQHTQALMERNMPEARRILAEIDKVQGEIKMEEGREIIEKAKASGMFERASQIISAVQILLCEANNMIGEVEDMFAEHSVVLDDIVTAQRQYYKAADKYFAEFGKIVDDNKLGNVMFKDIEDFDNVFRIWAGLKQMGKPKSLMDGCSKAANQANGRSKMCGRCQLTYNPDTLMCRACSKSFCEGFEKGARWLENKRIERITKKDKEEKK